MDIRILKAEASSKAKTGSIDLTTALGKDKNGNAYASHQVFVGNITDVQATWSKGLKRESSLILHFTFTGEEINSHRTEKDKTFDIYACPTWDNDFGFAHLKNNLGDQLGDAYTELSAEEYVHAVAENIRTEAGKLMFDINPDKLTQYMIDQYSRLKDVTVSVGMEMSIPEGGRASKYYYNLQEYKINAIQEIILEGGASTPEPAKTIEDLVRSMKSDLVI